MPVIHRLVAAALLVPLALSGCSQDARSAPGSRPRLGFVTNGISDFWTIAIAGARKAATEFDATVKVSQPTPKGRVSDQKSAIEDMLSAGFAGIAISPIEPANQTGFLDQVAAKTILITQDSDAPKSKRRCFIGVDNYEAGRMCGQLVQAAIPDGGKLMLFIGQLSGDNARLRRQGLIDELLGRSADPSRRDPTGTEIRSPDGRYIVLGCMTDDQDSGKGKSNAVDALTRHGDLACMVGLFAYNPPLILQALAQCGKLGKVAVVGFDEDASTLQGIRDGHVLGSVVQDPYRYGYESVRVLAGLARGDASVVPAGGIIAVPARKITKANVDAFEADLKARLGK